jgi:hypothetical protein
LLPRETKEEDAYYSDPELAKKRITEGEDGKRVTVVSQNKEKSSLKNPHSKNEERREDNK